MSEVTEPKPKWKSAWPRSERKCTQWRPCIFQRASAQSEAVPPWERAKRFIAPNAIARAPAPERATP
eukprot:11555973-Heterocapsa_arctica.AAC.1